MRAVAAAVVGASRRFRDMPCCEPASTVTAAGIPHRPQPAVATGKTLPILSTTIYRSVYLISPVFLSLSIYLQLTFNIPLSLSISPTSCLWFFHSLLFLHVQTLFQTRRQVTSSSTSRESSAASAVPGALVDAASGQRSASRTS